MLERAKKRSRTVKIALCGKYVRLHDAYLSVAEALTHAGVRERREVGDRLGGQRKAHPEGHRKQLAGVDGVLVPGGFGGRGIEGKILAAQYARETGVPYLGICLGMQTAVIEFARNVLGWEDANSSEFDPEGGALRHRHHARPARREEGRHHASRRVSVQGAQGGRCLKGHTARSSSPNGTAHRFEFNND